MAKRSPVQVFQDLINAGFSGSSAITEDAIAGAESGWDDTEQGDVNLENSTWGPSFGLYQIRTLKSATGTGSDRDIAWLSASDANQAKAAFDISAHGANFGPWTTYTSGAYQQFLGQAQAAAAGAGVNPASTSATPTGVLPGPWWLWGLGGAFLDSQAGQAVSGARNIAVEAAFAALGLGLVYAGFLAAVRPRLNAKKDEARKLALMAV